MARRISAARTAGRVRLRRAAQRPPAVRRPGGWPPPSPPATPGRVRAVYTSDLDRAREERPGSSRAAGGGGGRRPGAARLSHGRWEGLTHQVEERLAADARVMGPVCRQPWCRGGGVARQDLGRPAGSARRGRCKGERHPASATWTCPDVSLQILVFLMEGCPAVGIVNGSWFEVAHYQSGDWCLVQRGGEGR